jgi:hypothetical protein
MITGDEFDVVEINVVNIALVAELDGQAAAAAEDSAALKTNVVDVRGRLRSNF